MHKVFQESGATDEVSFRQVVKAIIDDAAHGFALFKLTSEYAELADSEKIPANPRAGGRSVKSSFGHHFHNPSIHHSLEVARVEAPSAAQIGSDASMVLSPLFLFLEDSDAGA